MNGGEGQTLLSVKCKLIHEVGMIRLEIHHLKTIIIASGKYQCMLLKLTGKSSKSKTVFT